MEPGLHGRGNRRSRPRQRQLRQCRNGARPSRPGKPHVDWRPSLITSMPQWSPAFTAGETGLWVPGAWAVARPQWSPAFTAGETLWPPHIAPAGDLAAMEPGLHGRGNGQDEPPVAGLDRAAMEPGLHGRGNVAMADRIRIPPGRAAMEPGLHGRGNVGAVPHLQGCRIRAAMEPGLHGRGNRGRHGDRGFGGAAAMEPGLHGRGNLRTVCRSMMGVNDAAMEPGLHGRGNLDTPLTTIASKLPQWSPAFTAGETRCHPRLLGSPHNGRNGARPSRPGKLRPAVRASWMVKLPQWSPAFTAGETWPSASTM